MEKCEYCGREFAGPLPKTAKSRHKRNCRHRRYLGGDLEIIDLTGKPRRQF